MDPFHERLARVALKAAADYGFCLAGGYAVQAHGFVDRVSKDVDLFTTMAAAADFPAAQTAVVAALRADGLDVAVEREGATFARLGVSEPASGATSTRMGATPVLNCFRRRPNMIQASTSGFSPARCEPSIGSPLRRSCRTN